jgi:GTP cyclohydrolase I
MDSKHTTWQELLIATVYQLQRDNGLDFEHDRRTAERVVAAYENMLSGYDEDPSEPLAVQFSTTAEGMIHVAPIHVTSTCRHHLMPIIGKVHFAYVPTYTGHRSNGVKIVGLSKIPRFIDILSRRLWVQEELCEEIVNVFDTYLKPAGCAVWMKAYHCCMSVRGANEHQAMTQYTALRGVFRDDAAARQELMAAINFNVQVIG